MKRYVVYVMAIGCIGFAYAAQVGGPVNAIEHQKSQELQVLQARLESAPENEKPALFQELKRFIESADNISENLRDTARNLFVKEVSKYIAIKSIAIRSGSERFTNELYFLLKDLIRTAIYLLSHNKLDNILSAKSAFNILLRLMRGSQFLHQNDIDLRIPADFSDFISHIVSRNEIDIDQNTKELIRDNYLEIARYYLLKNNIQDCLKVLREPKVFWESYSARAYYDNFYDFGEKLIHGTYDLPKNKEFALVLLKHVYENSRHIPQDLFNNAFKALLEIAWEYMEADEYTQAEDLLDYLIFTGELTLDNQRKVLEHQFELAFRLSAGNTPEELARALTILGGIRSTIPKEFEGIRQQASKLRQDLMDQGQAGSSSKKQRTR